MKIEMGESLFYSWLRHVKECQLVQTNWKVSPQWNLMHETELEEIKARTEAFFSERYGYNIYKHNTSLSQIIQQGECDALGISIQPDGNKVYAVDVAFHEGGLNYGDRNTTVMKIIAKCLRTAMCIYGYMDVSDAEIIFASPKIHRAITKDAEPCIKDMQSLMDELGYHFRFRIISNESFRDTVLNPILLVSEGVADTNELFLRSYQMLQMFGRQTATGENTASETPTNTSDVYAELKIGRLAQFAFAHMAEQGKIVDEELALMQTAEYSKSEFDLQYPVLVKKDSKFDKRRYYAKPLCIQGEYYMLCSQWFEVPSNNDRPFLIRWIEGHEVLSKDDNRSV